MQQLQEITAQPGTMQTNNNQPPSRDTCQNLLDCYQWHTANKNKVIKNYFIGRILGGRPKPY